MSESFSDAEKEILEVERRMVARAERMGRDWQDLRSSAKRKYALPALIAAAAVGAIAMGAAAGRRRRGAPSFQLHRGGEKATLMTRLIALASLAGTLRRLPIEPLARVAMDWMRSRRKATDMNSRASPITDRRRSA